MYVVYRKNKETGDKEKPPQIKGKPGSGTERTRFGKSLSKEKRRKNPASDRPESGRREGKEKEVDTIMNRKKAGRADSGVKNRRAGLEKFKNQSPSRTGTRGYAETDPDTKINHRYKKESKT